MPLRPGSKKARFSSEEARRDRFLWPGNKEEERLVHHQDSLESVEEERLSETSSRERVQREGEADLLLDPHIGSEARLAQIQNTP